MGVFDGSIQTATRPNGYANDNTPLPLRSLNVKAMATDTALPGVVGSEVMIVHGNSDYLIEHNLKLHVEQSMTELIDQNHENTVTGNKTQTIVGSTTQTFIGHHEQTNIAPRTDTFVHTRTEMHSQPELVHQPTETNEHHDKKNENVYKMFAYRMYFVQLADSAINLNALMEFSGKNREMKISYVNAQTAFFKHKMTAARNEIGAFCTELREIKVKAAASHTKAIAANLNAGFAANADSPVA